MSCAEIMSVLFFNELRFDPRTPTARNVDDFVLSKGHARADPLGRAEGGGRHQRRPDHPAPHRLPLEGHPTPQFARGCASPPARWARASPRPSGMAWARKRVDKIPAASTACWATARAPKGSVWEAAEFAAYYKLDNLVRDRRRQPPGPVAAPRCTSTTLDGYARASGSAFGWDAVGRRRPRRRRSSRPRSTRRAHASGKPVRASSPARFKGKGVSFLEDKEGWHGKPLKKGEELQQGRSAELGDTEVTIQVEPRADGPAPKRPRRSHAAELTPPTQLGAEVATREAFGAALAQLGKICAAGRGPRRRGQELDVHRQVQGGLPDRFVDCYIAEQNMVGVALGLATEGKIPFASTFACFLTRAFDFIRMAVYSKPAAPGLRAARHAGVSIGEDGASQMGLEDLAMFRGS